MCSQLSSTNNKRLWRKHAMSFVIGAELYDHLEKVVDRLEDVANEIDALVTDHL